MADADCLFCKILAGEVPASVVAESERAFAFRDINPVAPTHVLVIPRSHHPDAGTLAAEDPESLVAVIALGREIAEEAQLPGYRMVFNTGAAAQQTVFHAHLHVLGGRDFTWPPG